MDTSWTRLVYHIYNLVFDRPRNLSVYIWCLQLNILWYCIDPINQVNTSSVNNPLLRKISILPQIIEVRYNQILSRDISERKCRYVLFHILNVCNYNHMWRPSSKKQQGTQFGWFTLIGLMVPLSDAEYSIFCANRHFIFLLVYF